MSLRRSIEPLEIRRLLSASLPDVQGLEVARTNWKGFSGPAVAGQWIVQLGGYDGTMGSQLKKARRLTGEAVGNAAFVSQFLLQDGQFTVQLPRGWAAADQYATLARLPGFVSATPDWVHSFQATTPNDPSYSQLWGLSQASDLDIDAPEAWDISTGNMQQIVGVIDTGVDYNHADLYQNIYLNEREIPTSRKNNLTDIDGDGVITFRDLNNAANQGPFKITDQNADGRITGADLRAAMGTTGGSDNGTGGWADGVDNDTNFLADDLVGWNFREGNNNPMDVQGHGSHVAGTIGATGNNSTGVVGVNWKVRLLPLKTGGVNSGDTSISTSAAVASLNYARNLKQRGEQVAATNNSWGGGGIDGALEAAIQNHNTQGIMFVAAAGNGGADGIGDNNDLEAFYPSNYVYPNVISVLNLVQGGGRYFGSNYGATTVHLGAPGTNILSTTGGGYQVFTGTSMASPHVAGAVALIKAVAPGLTVTQVRNAILNNVDTVGSLSGFCTSGGRLNVFKAVSSVALAAGEAPTLSAASDTGASSTDNVTRDNTPTFTGTAAAGITVQLRADGNVVGTTTAAGNGNWTITSSPLADGARQMTVTVFNGVATSAPSPALTVVIDTVAPTASGGQHPVASAPQQVTVNFNESMEGGFTPSAITLSNLTTGAVIPANQMDVSFLAGNVARTTFGGVPNGGLLPDGNYRYSVQASDLAGNTMASAYQFTFYVMYGDGDRDRDVDIADFATMAGNFNSSPRNFAQGDYNYDGTVGIADFSLLASRFNTSLPAAGAIVEPGGAAASVAAASAPGVFSNVAVGEDRPTSIEDLLSPATA